MNLILDLNVPMNPKNGAYFEYKNTKFVSLYNGIIDSYGIYIVDKDYYDIYWSPLKEYIYPEINWELIWKEMDYCLYGYMRNYEFSISINGPEIKFINPKL